MARKFKAKIRKNPKKLLKKVRKAAADNDVEFKGDETSGKFEGTVSGKYTVKGDGPWTIRIKLTDWPWYISGAAVEDSVRDFFDD